MIRRLVLVLVVGLGSHALASPAEAIVRQGNGKFVFAPYTKNNDPVTILQIGGQSNDDICRFDSGRIARSTRCFASHLRTAWKNTRHIRKGTEMKPGRFCNGGDGLSFLGRPRIQNLRSSSTSSACEDQYHVRQWGDYEVNGSTPGEWSVMTAYYEVRSDLSVVPGSGRLGAEGHKVNQWWETTERIVLYEMRHSSRGEDRYCGQSDYRPFPGQRAGFDKRNPPLYNNARISRVSVQKPDYSRPAGQHCKGA